MTPSPPVTPSAGRAWPTASPPSISRFASAVATSTRLRGCRAGSGRSATPSVSFPILRRVRIGLLGGTFDPPHLVHLHAGEVAYRQLGLDRVLFVPAGAPWQKIGRKVSDPDDRLEMTRLATEGVDYFDADDREVHRDGWTYTAETLATFAADDEIVLILGSDAARNLPTWHRAAEVMQRAMVAVAPRPGIDRTEVASVLAEPLWLDMAPLDVSGTLIRDRVAAALPVRFLVRDSVWRYFMAANLYAPYLDVPVE